ncbi:hypothetical protein C7R88_03505 [Plesiomonas shigelloides]|nr:hypothetical protein C7R88_03505 [Plesiomonas shigelloides]
MGNNEIVNPNNDPYRNWVLSGNKGIISFEYEYFLPTVNSAIKANDKVQLLKVTFEKYDAELLDLTEEQFSFLLTYTSMYEDKLCVSGI